MDPPAPPDGGAVKESTIRSGPIWMAATAVLLLSAVSGTEPSPSAWAIRKYDPAGVPAGIVSGVEAALDAPGPSAGTDRLPIGVSAPSRIASADRKNFVTEAAALPPAWFLVVSLTVKGDPVPDVAGAVSAEMIRSAPIWMATVAVLLPSCTSATDSSPSAFAIQARNVGLAQPEQLAVREQEAPGDLFRSIVAGGRQRAL